MCYNKVYGTGTVHYIGLIIMRLFQTTDHSLLILTQQNQITKILCYNPPTILIETACDCDIHS